VSIAAITLCIVSQRVFIFVNVYFVMTQSGNFWIHPRITDVSSRQYRFFINVKDGVKMPNLINKITSQAS
jgi:hypothetical protein